MTSRSGPRTYRGPGVWACLLGGGAFGLLAVVPGAATDDRIAAGAVAALLAWLGWSMRLVIDDRGLMARNLLSWREPWENVAEIGLGQITGSRFGPTFQVVTRSGRRRLAWAVSASPGDDTRVQAVVEHARHVKHAAGY